MVNNSAENKPHSLINKNVMMGGRESFKRAQKSLGLIGLMIIYVTGCSGMSKTVNWHTLYSLTKRLRSSDD